MCNFSYRFRNVLLVVAAPFAQGAMQKFLSTADTDPARTQASQWSALSSTVGSGPGSGTGGSSGTSPKRRSGGLMKKWLVEGPSAAVTETEGRRDHDALGSADIDASMPAVGLAPAVLEGDGDGDGRCSTYARDQIDDATLAELPADIRTEILADLERATASSTAQATPHAVGPRTDIIAEGAHYPAKHVSQVAKSSAPPAKSATFTSADLAAQSVLASASAVTQVPEITEENIDLEVLNALPPALRREIAVSMDQAAKRRRKAKAPTGIARFFPNK